MEEIKTEKNCGRRCSGCFSYHCYYTKGFMRFIREKKGYCHYNDKTVGNKETCEKWTSNSFRRHRMDKGLVKALDDTIGELVEITTIIKDNIENKQLSELARERLTQKLNEIESEIDKED